MRHVNFEIRVLCFAAIAAFLFYYQNHVSNEQLGVTASASEKMTTAAAREAKAGSAAAIEEPAAAAANTAETPAETAAAANTAELPAETAAAANTAETPAETAAAATTAESSAETAAAATTAESSAETAAAATTAESSAETSAAEITAAATTEEASVKAITEVSASAYIDGTYKSSAQGYDGPVKVEVTVENGLIAAVEVTSAEGEDPAFLADAKAIIGYMIEAQSTDVDSISGATLTAEGIRRATEKALKKAVPEE